MVEKCIECDKPAVWTRHTQFAGNHPYCEEHAKKESDWNENDSYTYWKEIEKECNPHPNAPHGFLRQASHDAGRYVCECEWWDEKDYELATLEEANAFAEKRNYTYTVEKCPWDEWKPTKDIV